LAEVHARDGESFESLLNRFKRQVQYSGVLREAKKRRHFESPSAERKKKAAIKLRKSRRSSRGESKPEKRGPSSSRFGPPSDRSGPPANSSGH
jgi:small subunit ribosomal protein S21